jgi:hypothetical protein
VVLLSLNDLRGFSVAQSLASHMQQSALGSQTAYLTQHYHSTNVNPTSHNLESTCCESDSHNPSRLPNPSRTSSTRDCCLSSAFCRSRKVSQLPVHVPLSHKHRTHRSKDRRITLRRLRTTQTPEALSTFHPHSPLPTLPQQSIQPHPNPLPEPLHLLITKPPRSLPIKRRIDFPINESPHEHTHHPRQSPQHLIPLHPVILPRPPLARGIEVQPILHQRLDREVEGPARLVESAIQIFHQPQA